MQNSQLPGGLYPLPEDTNIVRGLNGRCWDQNEKVYKDFALGCGPLSIGHSNLEVNQAAIEQMSVGAMLPYGNHIKAELSSILQNLFPHTPNIRFMKTGSESVGAAIRLARASTGQPIIIRCGFLGWHDQVISPDVSWHRYTPDRRSPRLVTGVPVTDKQLMIPWSGEDLEELEQIFSQNKFNVAALILDPVQLRKPLADNLRAISDLTRRNKALLVLDEVKTGYRVDLRGVQGLYKVTPDISIFSKGIANGFPLAVIQCSEEMSGLLNEIQIMGTYNGELISIAAAIKTISILQRHDSIAHINNMGEILINGINDIVVKYGLSSHIQAVPYRWSCMPFIWFREDSEVAQNMKPYFYKRLVQEGVLMFANHMNYICLTHSLSDIEETLRDIEIVLQDCISLYSQK